MTPFILLFISVAIAQDVTLPNVFPDAPSALSLSIPPIPLHCMPGFLTAADVGFCCRRYDIACPDRPHTPIICMTDPQSSPALCCMFGIACPSQGVSCSANQDCTPNLGCVFENLQQQRGKCGRVDVFGLACTIAFCEGENSPCVLPGPVYTTCSVWLSFLNKVRPTPTIGAVASIPSNTVGPEVTLAPDDITISAQQPQISSEVQVSPQAVISPALDEILPSPTVLPSPELTTTPSANLLPTPAPSADLLPTPTPSASLSPTSTTSANLPSETPQPPALEKKPEGTTCSTISQDVPQRCADSLTCVIHDFGLPSSGVPNEGTCQLISRDIPVCTVQLCATYGAAHLCSLPFVFVGTVTTCGTWHKPSEAIPGPNCRIICVGVCVTGPGAGSLIASNGRPYCGLCDLQRDSCESGFVIYGPVFQSRESASPTPSARPIDPACLGTIGVLDAEMCCRVFAIGCMQEGDACSAFGAMIPGPDCEKGLTCVIDDFGFPAVDQPNSGKCERLVERPVLCTVAFCTMKGREGVCREAETSVVTTCGVWAKPSQAVSGPDCEFFCSQICNIGPDAPVGSDGVTYCSVCQMRAVSCRSGFEVFGPVNV